jgi:hypothetical protein
VAREQRLELDVEELVAVQREARARLAPLARSELQASPTPERLLLARERELDADALQRSGELVLLPGAAAHDHPLDAGPGQSTDLVLSEWLPADVDERLRTPLRGIAEPLGSAAREEDRLH